MKKTILSFITVFGVLSAIAHEADTLKNHAVISTLEAGKYSGSDWGFYAGHNSKEQQQFGEQYVVKDHVHVLGVVAYLTTSTGVVHDPHFELDFRLWQVDPATGKPSGTKSIDDGHIHLEDVTLDGPTIVMFHNETHVEDAFVVSMDLGDYAHDGLAGDTVGLYYAPHGTRTAADIATVPFRNVFQAHGHGATPNWKDFYTQFTTPDQIATHLAIYPIVAFEEHTNIATVSQNKLEIKNPYPNPASHQITIPVVLNTSSATTFSIMDLTGKVLQSINKGILPAGEHIHNIDISTLAEGAYILSIVTNVGALGTIFHKI